MFETSNLTLPLMAPSQAQKHVTHNEALRRLDALVQLSVVSRSQSYAPSDPGEGERHIVAASPSGEWLGHAGEIAAFQNGAWSFLTPRPGWIAYVSAENAVLLFVGTDWDETIFRPETAPRFGVNASADDYNRFVVKSNSALFSHDDVSGGGNGSVLGTFNKQGAGNDAGFNFQDGYSTRALMGLYGDDDFRIKVSPDGNAYHEALVVDRTSGAVRLPATKAVAIGGHADGAQAIAASTFVDLEGFVLDLDQLGDSQFATGALTVGAADAGVWAVGFNGQLDGSAPGLTVDCLLNGSVHARARIGDAATQTGGLTALIAMGAGDVLRFRTFHDAGTPRRFDTQSRFFASRLGG